MQTWNPQKEKQKSVTYIYINEEQKSVTYIAGLNMADSTPSYKDTTTNSCEGFNNAIQLSVPHNASMWTVIHQFKTEESLVHVKLRDAAVGNTSEKKTSAEH